MALVGTVVLLLASVLALWVGARWLVTGAARIAASLGISSLVIGLTVVAFGTSAPEVAVSIGATIEGRADVSVGNVVGSNIFNLGVILGVVAVLSPFRVAITLLRRDALAMAVATGIGTLVLANLVVSRLEGAILVSLLAGYVGGLAFAARRERATPRETGEGVSADGAPVDDATPAAGESTVRFGLEGGRVLAGLALVVVGGRLLVDAATTIALAVGVSEWVIGVTIVAAGTSLPELVTSVVAARRDAVAIAAGNVIGSNVFNLLGVLGLAAVVRPMTVDSAVLDSFVWLGVVTAIATIVLATGRRLTRLEGGLLIALAASYWAVSALG